MVKQWAKAWELVGSSDGHLNSYAFTLLTIYFLMNTRPSVVPNLQDAACNCESVNVKDQRWGQEAPWDCKFWEMVELIPRSMNSESTHTLLHGFFKFYAEFNWSRDVVSIRLGLTPSATASKFKLYSPLNNKEQWYIEDPFDLRHNLASQCTSEGRRRILEKMRETLEVLDAAMHEGLPRLWASHCSRAPTRFLLKCRIHTDKVSASEYADALRAVRNVGPFTVRFPAAQRSREVIDAFAVFGSDSDRRRVHRLNETYIGEWQLRLLPCSTWALEDALRLGDYEELEVTPLEEPSEAASEQREPATVDPSVEVRNGLRVAQTEEEVQVLIQRAEALGLSHEADLGGHKLRQMTGKASARARARTDSDSAGAWPRTNAVAAGETDPDEGPEGGAAGGLKSSLSATIAALSGAPSKAPGPAAAAAAVAAVAAGKAVPTPFKDGDGIRLLLGESSLLLQDLGARFQ